MSDPLSLLRQATIAGTPVVSVDGKYTFGSIQLSEKTSTCFRRTIKGSDYFYTLKDIVMFLANADLGEAEYRRKVVQEGGGATFVVTYDRPSLKSYITGEVDSCPQIDLQLAASYQLPPEAVSSSSNVDLQTMSKEKMQEQRERYAAQMEKTIQKSKSGGADQGESMSSLKELKRKAVHAFGGGDGESEIMDRQFLEADRKILESLRSDELPAHTRATVMNAPGTDFSIVLKLFSEKVLKPMLPTKGTATAPAAPGVQRRPGHAAPIAPASASDPSKIRANPSTTQYVHGGDIGASGASGASGARKTPSRQYPIIIVPSAPTSCITLLNAEDFLVNGEYHTMEEKRKQAIKKPRELFIPRKRQDGKVVVYRVLDDPRNLNDVEWNLVVAVFATGQTWQFKQWKHPTPVTLFQNVLGVHVCVDSATVDANIQSWNCKVLKVNLFKQHMNASASREFWMYVDDFVKLHRHAPLPSSQSHSHTHSHAHANATAPQPHQSLSRTHHGNSVSRTAAPIPPSALSSASSASSVPGRAQATAQHGVRFAPPPPPPGASGSAPIPPPPQYRAPPAAPAPPAPPAPPLPPAMK